MILPSKGPTAFDLFIQCLQEEKEHMGHQELAQELAQKLAQELAQELAKKTSCKWFIILVDKPKSNV